MKEGKNENEYDHIRGILNNIFRSKKSIVCILNKVKEPNSTNEC